MRPVFDFVVMLSLATALLFAPAIANGGDQPADEPVAATVPAVPIASLPVADVAIDLGRDVGPLEVWRHTVGHGGINWKPLPGRVVDGLERLRPRLIRVFIQEFFAVYPEHGRFDWSRLDPYMDALARTGAKVVAAIAIKPRPLFPEINARVWRPNDVEEWQRVIAALVRRYSVDRPIVSHWEIGNETDIGENGGCPYLIPDPADYASYYKMTLAPIVEAFPRAKVGGCAVANAASRYLPQFIERCRDERVQLDFISWHLYSDDPAQHAQLVEKYRALLEPFGDRRPEMMITEWSKGFDRVSVEELASEPRRAATVGACLVALTDARVDWSFYYHAWDQVCDPADFRPFFQDPGIMVKHWNEVPHRFGLFGVGQEARPAYFVYRMMARLGDRRVAARSDAPDLRVLGARRGDAATLLLVNYGQPASRDRIATLHFAALTPGRKILTAYRVDRGQAWSATALELRPTERREVVVGDRFQCQIVSPADSVSLVSLESAE